MSTPSVTYSFSNATPAVASQVNTNYSDIISFLTSSVVHKDGTVAMTGALTLPSDPTNVLHAATKQYVDGLSGMTFGTWTPTFTQTATITKTVNQAFYVQLGQVVLAWAMCSATSSGTSGGSMRFTLPVNMHADHLTSGTVGSCRYSNGSNTTLPGVAVPISAGVVSFDFGASPSGAVGGVDSTVFQIVSGNSISCALLYRKA